MKHRIIITVLLLVTFAGYGLYAGLQPAGTDDSIQPASVRPPAAQQPDADNVTPGYLEQVARLESYLADNPEDTTHLLRLARIYHDGHQPVSAAVYYERLLDVNPDNRQVWLDLANCYAESMQWEKALGTTRAMLDRFPDDGEALYNLGAVYANLGKGEQAADVWNDMLEGDLPPGMRELVERSLELLQSSLP